MPINPKNIVKQAFVSSNSSDLTPYPKLQVTFNGKPTDAIRLEPYGVWSMPPKGSHAVCLAGLGNDATLFAISNDYLNRPKNLKEGDVVHGAFKFGAFAYYQNTGQTSLVGETLYIGTPEISLIGKLRGILAAIQELTVPTAVGASGVPVNAADFLAIDTELASIEAGAPNVS